MIVDTLQNINLYKNISDDIFTGLEFIKNATPEIGLGVYQLNNRVKAMITAYDTKTINELGFEAHVENIDIQYPIIGNERVYWAPIGRGTLKGTYDKEKDIGFYDLDRKSANYVDIGRGVFAILFPEDTHAPQYYVDKIERLKKITVKIKIR